MHPKIVFGVISATACGDAVTQLARGLLPHRVLVHHDQSKGAEFVANGTNIRMVPEPKVTGWGTWGFADAIFQTMRYAQQHCDYDFFQLLSPSCLPIRPLAQLERRVRIADFDVHADLLPIDRDADTLMNFGFRSFVPDDTLRMRGLRRLRKWYFGEEPELLQTQSLSLVLRNGEPVPWWHRQRTKVALAATRLARRGGLGSHPFQNGFRPVLCGTWFGVTPPVVDYLLMQREDPELERYFARLPLVEEILFGSLLANSPFRIGHANTAINDFMRDGHPRWIEAGDFERLRRSGRNFARKFDDDPASPLRQRALRHARPSTFPVVDAWGTNAA